MAIFDLASKTIALKIVYYGCALGGKTTNLLTLHRLTDPGERQGLVSIATKDDRTLFFDLLPIDLGQIGGLTVRVKVYTVPGQVHYEVTRRQVLAGTDGVVLVMDSTPDVQQSNAWARENLFANLSKNGLDRKTIPIVLQWNKRDLPDAVSIEQLETTLNQDKWPSLSSVATVGTGVVETFAAIVKGAVVAAYRKSGRKSVSEEELERLVDASLAGSKHEGTPGGGEEQPAFDHRFDSDAYRSEWAEKGRDRQILDENTLLSEAVQTSMELAEKLDGMHSVAERSRRQETMLGALRRLAACLADSKATAIPHNLVADLLSACRRSRGSLLLFQGGKNEMEERQVVPPGADPLNALTSPSVGSAAFRLCQGETPKLVEDLRSEVFFDAAPEGAESLASSLIVPVVCDGAKFGALVIYGVMDEETFEDGEREFWSLAAVVLALSLHWRALRRKLSNPAQPVSG